MVKITDVECGSIAEKSGIRAGDILISIDGNDILDVLDYRFYLSEKKVALLLEREGDRYTVNIKKGEYDDIGLGFETPLMDKKHSCKNGCIFCFIDQNPEGLRESLYFKDDDSRLSFIHGNYITLTNMTERDVARIVKMRFSPINVSVHTTNPDLRVKMMKNKHAGEVLSYLDRMADAGIALCTQIVLCKGLNDGAELDRTLHDLIKYHPSLRSCAIVPVGLTKYREKLYPLEAFSPAECAAVIEQVNAYGNWCLKEFGTRIFYCSDEFYVRAGLPLPPEEFYEDYSQIENGVGMLTSMKAEFDMELDYLDELLADFRAPRTVSVITGMAAHAHITSLAKELTERVDGLTVNVYPIVNKFFGESVTVAGLITGGDVIEQLNGKDLGDELLFPSVMLRADGDVFLDDMTPDELGARLGVPVRATESDGAKFVSALLGICE